MMRGLVIILSLFSCALGMSIRTNSNPSEVSFSLYATNLSKCNLITPCDTSVEVLCQSVSSDWRLCDKTRVIWNSNNPVWPKVFTFEHEPGTRQRWRLDLKEHDLIGGSSIISSFMVNVDDYVESNVELTEHPIPNDRGSLWVQRRTNSDS